jgi:hypothetical protein
MRDRILFIFLTCIFFAGISQVRAQYTPAPPAAKPSQDIKAYVRKATVRSAIIPGWGQAYNKKYWKIPIIYGALGTTGYLFVRNLQQFKDSKEAYQLASDNDPNNDYLIKEPYYSVRTQPQRIKDFRNEVRQNMDYCILFFLVFWGLNVIDASVDAHLKAYDISNDLSLRLKPVSDPVTRTAGLGLVLRIGK